MKISSTITLPYPYNLLRDINISDIDNPHLIDDIEQTVNSLTDKEQTLIRLRYKEGKTLKESGDVIGVSKEYTRCLINNIIWKIKHSYRYNKIVYGKMPGEYLGERPLTIDDLDLSKRTYALLSKSGCYELKKLNGKTSSDKVFHRLRIGIKTLSDLNLQTEQYGVRVLIED